MTTVPPWIPDTAPHPAAYPTSADLAAFRSALHAALPPHHADDCGITDPPEGMAAWEDEREHGVGLRAAERRLPVYVTDPADPRSLLVMSANDADRLRAVLARREAAAMRSRAFARVDGAYKADAWAREWSAIRATFEPR